MNSPNTYYNEYYLDEASELQFLTQAAFSGNIISPPTQEDVSRYDLFFMSGVLDAVMTVDGFTGPPGASVSTRIGTLRLDDNGDITKGDLNTNVFELQDRVKRLESIVEAQGAMIDRLITQRSIIRRIRRG